MHSAGRAQEVVARWNRLAENRLIGSMGQVPRAVDDVSEAQSFAAFYEEQFSWARRLACVLTGDRGVGDDIAQEAFARVSDRFDDLTTPRAYMRVVIVNLARRHGRDERRRRVAEGIEPDELVVVTSESAEILDVIDRLPARQRAVIVLRYFEQLSEVEIAEALSCRPGTVKSLASRALARLRKELDHD
jgi:RNA polymerase sigma factor (sigma-70 family)